MDTLLVLDTCLASDVVQIDFEDPSKRVTTLDTDLGLSYNSKTANEMEKDRREEDLKELSKDD